MIVDLDLSIAVHVCIMYLLSQATSELSTLDVHKL